MLTRLITRICTALALTATLLSAPHAHAHGVTLIVHHYLPADSAFHTQFILPWTQKLEKESSGLLRFRHFPAMQLGGDPGKLTEQVLDRTADIVFTLTRQTPGRYPAIEAFEVTPVKYGAVGASRAAWEYVRLNDLADKEFDELRLLGVAVVGTGDVQGPADVGLLLMNGRSYKTLIDTLKAVITANSGADTSAWLAKVLSGANAQSAITPSQQAVDAWIKRATEHGANAGMLGQSAREQMAEFDKAK